MNIFRKEVVSQTNEKFYGNILLAKPIGFSVLTTLFLIIVFSIFMLFLFCSYTRKTDVLGVIMPEQGVVRISSDLVGIIKKINVAEGTYVKKGERLFTLSGERSGERESLLLLRKEQILNEMKELSKKGKVMHNTLEEKTKNIQTIKVMIEEQISIQKKQIKITESFLNKYNTLLGTGAISQIMVKEKEAELLSQKASLVGLLRDKISLISEEKSIKAQSDEFEVDLQRDYSSYKNNYASVLQSLSDINIKKEIIIKSPRDGILSSITISVGETIDVKQTLATISPSKATLEAILYIPPKDIGFIHQGMDVLIRYQAYPYQKFGQFNGVIKDVSQSVLLNSDIVLPIFPENSGEGIFYRAHVSLKNKNITINGKEMSLKPGMKLEASILLEQRKIYEWILEPLYTLNGTM